MKKTKEECLLMNGIMSFDLGKNEARIMKAMDDWAEDVVKNLSSNPLLSDEVCGKCEMLSRNGCPDQCDEHSTSR